MPRSISLPIFIILLFVVFMMLVFIDHSLRYAKYSLPFITVFLIVIFYGDRFRNLMINRDLVKYYGILILLYSFLILQSIIVCVSYDSLNIRLFSEGFFILSPLILCLMLAFFIKGKVFDKCVLILFWGAVVHYLIMMVMRSTFAGVSTPSDLFMALLLPSDIETGMAYNFGLLTIYFVMTRKVKYSIAGFLLTVFSFKRIGVLGLLIALISIFVLRSSYKEKKNHNILLFVLVAMNFLAVLLFRQFANGAFDELIATQFDMTSNELTLGRQALFSSIFDNMDPSFFGVGLGNIYQEITSSFEGLDELHSDILKSFFEFGVVGFFIWIFVFYRVNIKNLGMLALTIFMNVLFLTDNVFIYFYVTFVYYFLVIGLMQRKE